MGLGTSTSVSRTLFIEPKVVSNKPGYIDSGGVFHPIRFEKNGAPIAPSGTEVSGSSTQISLTGNCLYSGAGKYTRQDRVAKFIKVAERWLLESVVPVGQER